MRIVEGHKYYLMGVLIVSQLLTLPLVAVHNVGTVMGYLIALLSQTGLWVLMLMSLLYVSFGVSKRLDMSTGTYRFLVDRVYLYVSIMFFILSSLTTVFLASLSTGLAWFTGNFFLVAGYIVLLRGLQIMFGRGFYGFSWAVIVFAIVFASHILGLLATVYVYKYTGIPLSTSLWADLYMGELIGRGLGIGWSLPGTLLIMLARIVLEK